MAISLALILSISSLFPYLAKNEIKKPTASSKELTVMQANVFKFNFNYEPLLKQIEELQPDVIALAEVTPKWRDALLADLEKNWSYIIDHSQLGSHGMMIFSKLPIVNEETEYFSRKNIPTLFFSINWNDKDIDFVSLHPLPPVCFECIKSRDYNFDGIVEKVKKQTNNNVIIMGDMNTTMFSPSYKHFVNGLGLVNAREGFGIYGTWPVAFPSILRLPIDHILYSGDIKATSFQALPSVDSDHLSTIATLQ